ncbi:MAG TPA: hypothetical protein VFA55_04745 [Candidatus Kapabacteria bacterium]|nr:hypothetical protein [Candidatus Kapabacteria bacterium]
MKKLVIIFSIVSVLASFSCKNQTTQPNPIQTYNSDDPIARALGEITEPYPSHGQFDVGVVLERNVYYFDSVTSAYAAMAFDTNKVPAKADSSSVNGRALIWTEYYEPGVFLNIFSDSTSFGNDDSMPFSYTNFVGDSYSGVAAIAPPFNDMVLPDTISKSKGFQITYSNPIPGNSIIVRMTYYNPNRTAQLNVIDTLPDTGTLVIGPGILPQDTSIFHFGVYLYREEFITQISPSGKRIGIYSNMSEYCIAAAKL